MNVLLKSKEGEVFKVSVRIMKCASNIMWMTEKYKIEGPFPLHRISSMILHKIISWADYHKNDPLPMDDDNEDEDTEGDIDPWDAKLLNVDAATMSEIVEAADCLGIKALCATCKALTKTLKKKKTSN
nr:S-phase kinase-associated protein 1-like [Drosophila kikkawai]